MAFDASITGRIETILNPLLTTTLDIMLDAKLSAHLTRVDERLAEAIVNSRSQPRPDVSGTEDSVLGNIEGAENVVLDAANKVSDADRSPDELADHGFDNNSQHEHDEAPLLQHETDSADLHSGDARFQRTLGQGGRGHDNSALGRGRGRGDFRGRVVNPYAGNRTIFSQPRNTNDGGQPQA